MSVEYGSADSKLYLLKAQPSGTFSFWKEQRRNYSEDAVLGPAGEGGTPSFGVLKGNRFVSIALLPGV
jgi:hypothetical protein